MQSPPAAIPVETILFRPSKKRKIYRQRAQPDGEEAHSGSPASGVSGYAGGGALVAKTQQVSLDELIASRGVPAEEISPGRRRAEEDGGEDGMRISMPSILRLRKQRKARVGGVGFSAGGKLSARDEESVVVMEAARDDSGEEREAQAHATRVVRRFAPQTGTVGDVNKHMMAYIDSELAKRRFEGQQSTVKNSTTSATARVGAGAGNTRDLQPREGEKKDLDVQRQPATQGKLLEIDLGDEARDRNVERTNRARRKLDGEEVDEEGVGSGKSGKVRLGRDGKPWRGRKRRDSEDVKRDKLVEEVLRENRLEMYEEPAGAAPVVNNDEAADDRMAEAFRREFMDAVSARQRKKAVPAQPPGRGPGSKKEEEVLKGPKLGGSRSARAAMRETMLKSGKK